ncbi:glutaminyl-peptide cyclotransferase [bacterium]|nr:glutaminyl-peptide cyclotransferase [bacterium]
MKTLWLWICLVAAVGAQPALQVTAPVLRPTLIKRYPHDVGCFTQGLVWLGSNRLLESSGLEGQSQLRLVDLETGVVQVMRPLEDSLFAEGLAVLNQQVRLLTYRNRRFLEFDLAELELRTEASLDFEGWGLTVSPSGHWLASNGSPNLLWLNPDMSIARQMLVREPSGPVPYLNELEWCGKRILANVYTTELIAVITPETGLVDYWLDLSGLLTPEEKAGASFANGIAWDPATGHLFVTGKYWPWVFELDVDYDIGLE